MTAGSGITVSSSPEFARIRELVDLVPSDCFYSSEPWLTMPHRTGRNRQFLLARDESGAGAAIALTPGAAVRSRRYQPFSLLAGRIPNEECVLAGPLSGYRTTLLRGRTPLATVPAARALFEASESSVLLLPYLESQEAAELAGEGIPVGFTAWEAWLDVPAGGFEEFRVLLPRDKRQRVAADLRKTESAGIRFETELLTGELERISALLAAHDRKYDDASVLPDAAFVEHLERCVAIPGAYCVKAFIADTLVGACVLFHYAEQLWVRLVGVDDSRPDTRGCYFSLVYYEPMKLAWRLSARAVHLGVGAMTTKLWRGARAAPLWTAALSAPGRHRSMVVDGLAEHARRPVDLDFRAPGPIPALSAAKSTAAKRPEACDKGR